MVADVGRNSLWDGCAAARTPVRLGLVRSAAIAGPRAECRESHAGRDGENAGRDYAGRLASGAGETGGDSQPGLSTDKYGLVCVGVEWRAPAGRPERGRR